MLFSTSLIIQAGSTRYLAISFSDDGGDRVTWAQVTVVRITAFGGQ